MKLTQELRELIRDFQLLDHHALNRMQALGGLRGSINLLQELLSLFSDLNRRLDEIDEEHAKIALEIEKHPEEVDARGADLPTNELEAAEEALQEVLVMIGSRGARSIALNRLHNALLGLIDGASPAAMLTAAETGGRPLDSPTVQYAKGMLAAALHVRQKMSGESRAAAAAWVVKHTSRELSRRLSRKPITPRAVIEWLDRFGGEHASPGDGRTSFVYWEIEWGGRPFTPENLRAVSGYWAPYLPTLAA
jgi:hypothetical protein